MCGGGGGGGVRVSGEGWVGMCGCPRRWARGVWGGRGGKSIGGGVGGYVWVSEEVG